ncbi:MAG: GH15 [uncultured Nocardioidaceae bacterium]|uniref:GH15 n=1 Tax=uncultured Nocardioidaceae bacterium TaxID=253824 RepID=A0A6J4L2A8_9ACTN|nr:MAG: GH15 [uncultured Nocardioidaceae bacterium]
MTDHTAQRRPVDARSRTRASRLLAAAALPLVLGAASAPAAAVPSTGTSTARAGEAPGGPGVSSRWTTGAKNGLGTSAGTGSKVWFTLTGGMMSEVYYPGVDVANVKSLQVVVSDGSTFTDVEGTDTVQRVQLRDRRSLSYRQVNTDVEGRYRVVKTYLTDPDRASVVVKVEVVSLDGGDYRAYLLYDPHLANSGRHDTGRTVDGRLVATDTSGERPVASALAARPRFRATSSGFDGTSDGLTDLRDDHALDWRHDSATNGNVVQVAELRRDRDGRSTSVVALSFGRGPEHALDKARASLGTAWGSLRRDYRAGWHRYLDRLSPAPRSVADSTRLATQYDVALMTLRAHEDKTYRGANIASLTVPWGEAVDADEPGVGGYHLVWARDLYQVATAQLAAGDEAAADRSLDYLFDVQQNEDGSFPQNTLLDGTPYFGSLQLDEVALPIVLARQLRRFDRETWDHVRRAADFLVAHGPVTPQERWEEEGGYSPSTIAAEIAGLVSAADLARRQGDEAARALYLATADDWRSRVKEWTVTTTGLLGDQRYFLRVDGNGDPDDGQLLEINNGGGTHDERAVVDAGFLELVRLGVLPADDPDVTGSLPEVDATIGKQTPNGFLFYRYNHDGYGENADGSPYDGTGVGRLWPLLTGERGEYALAAGRSARSHLETMARTGNDGFLIPEQVWDQPDAHGFRLGEGTGSATPLAWSMAQFVRLAASIDAGRPVERPEVVARRYAAARPAGPDLELTSPTADQTTAADSVEVSGTTDGRKAYVHVGGRTLRLALDEDGDFSRQVSLGLGQTRITVAAVGADGGTTLLQRTVTSTNLGTPLGSKDDPAGDDHGPGSYVYPTNDAFVDGAFDLTRLGVYEADDTVNLALTIDGELTNPWGGDQISVQRFDVYVRPGGVTSAGTVAARTGTHADLAAPYSFVVTADGFSGSAIRDADDRVVAQATLTAIPDLHQLVVSVPRSAFSGVNLGSARYVVTAMSHASTDEGAGEIRPVYSLDFWESTAGTDQSWIQEYRFGGGAGEWSGDNPTRDTDTSDPNVLDLLVPDGSDQSEVLDWTADDPVVLPYVDLTD